VPLAPRAVSIACLVGAVLIGAAAVAGCGPTHDATGFCATIERGHAAFDSTDQSHAPRALAEFDRVTAAAPASVAPDLSTVASVLRDPAVLANNPTLVKGYFAAIARVDRYLHRTCGLTVPPVGKLF
jgi:hypothetical protein